MATFPGITVGGDKKDILSVEIGERFLKVALVRVSKEKRELTAVSSANIVSISDDAIADKIRDFAKTQRLKNPDIVSVIPSHFVISKNIEIPSIDKKEIKDIIDLQAGRHTPYAREEIVMDYTDIGVFHGRYTKILLIIVKRDVVAKRYDIIKKAGFKVERVVLGAEVVARFALQALPDKPADKPAIFIHIDNGHTDFAIAHNGKMIYMRPIPIGLIQLESGSKEAKANFVAEIKKSIESYQAENIEVLPQAVYVVGVSQVAAAFESDIKDLLGPAATIRAIRDIKELGVNASLPNLAGMTSFSILPPIAAGMFAQSDTLNLIPEDIKLKREIKRKAHEITKIGILCMTCLIVFLAIPFTTLMLESVYFKKLLSSYTVETEESNRLRFISDRTMVMKRFLNQKGKALFVLTEFFSNLPKEMYLNSISYREDDTVSFTGTADSMSRVFSFVTDLENSKSFKNVKVDFTKTRRVKDQEVADFGLTLALEEYVPYARTGK